MSDTVRLFKHPTAPDVWLRPIYYIYGKGHACQLYRYSPDVEPPNWWWDYDGRVDMKDDLQFHQFGEAKDFVSIDLHRDDVEVRAGDPVDVWCYVASGGDGSVSIRWYLTKDEAFKDHDAEAEPFCESEPERVETYEGSNIWWEAVSDKVKKEHEVADGAL